MENLKLYIIVLLANSKMRIIHARRPIAVHIIITTNKRINTVCLLPLQLNFISFENHLLEQVHKLYFLMVLNFRKARTLPHIKQHTPSNVTPSSKSLFWQLYANIMSFQRAPEFFLCAFYHVHFISYTLLIQWYHKVCFISWWFANSLGWGALSLFICLLAFLFFRDLHIYCFILYKPDLGSLRRFIIYIHVAKSWQ